MKRYLLAAMAALFIVSSGYAAAWAAGCCKLPKCDCGKTECCAKGECSCKGKCCTQGSCACGQAGCGKACDCASK